MPEYGAECEFFTVISIDSLLIYDKKFYLQVYLDICAYKIVDKQMIEVMTNFLSLMKIIFF